MRQHASSTNNRYVRNVSWRGALKVNALPEFFDFSRKADGTLVMVTIYYNSLLNNCTLSFPVMVKNPAISA